MDFHSAEMWLPFPQLCHANTLNPFFQRFGPESFPSANEEICTQYPCRNSWQRGSTSSPEWILEIARAGGLYDWGNLGELEVRSAWCCRCWDCRPIRFGSSIQGCFSYLIDHSRRTTYQAGLKHDALVALLAFDWLLVGQRCLFWRVRCFLYLLLPT